MKRAKWQYWKHPKTGLWNAHSHKQGHAQFSTNQGFAHLKALLNAIESASGSREAELVEWKDRVKSPRRKK